MEPTEVARLEGSDRFHEAAELALAADSVTLSIGSRYQTMLFGLLEAEFLAEAGRTDEASTLISRSRALLEHAPALDCWLAALAFMESWLAQATGDRAVALDKLRAALSLANWVSARAENHKLLKLVTLLASIKNALPNSLAQQMFLRVSHLRTNCESWRHYNKQTKSSP